MSFDAKLPKRGGTSDGIFDHGWARMNTGTKRLREHFFQVLLSVSIRVRPGLNSLWLPLRCARSLRPCAKHILFSATALSTLAAEPPKAPVPKSPYIAVVYRYADTMLEKGRDTFGPQKTELFLSALDRATLAPLTNRPAAPAGVRESSRVGKAGQPLTGANPQHDENLLRVLSLVSDLTAKPKYREAADAAMRWFITKAREGDRLPWGESGYWDVIADKPVATDGVQEFSRPWMLWDRCFALAPETSQQYALSLRDDPKSAQLNLPRQAGFFFRTWAAAYAHTKEERFLKAIEALLQRFERKRHPTTGLIENDDSAATVSSLSMAIECDGAAHVVPEPLASRLRAFAAREDEIFSVLPHDLAKLGGFVTRAVVSTGKAGDRPTTLWSARDGVYTTAQVGMMCVSRYDNSGRLGHRDLLFAAADAYLDSMPAEGDDVWPGTFGHAISLQLAAWRHSAKPVYMERARKFADLATEKFFGTNALPRASLKSEHYESRTGADTLVLALAELHLHVLHITAVRCPPNTIDR
jgi:hypothetical protein